ESRKPAFVCSKVAHHIRRLACARERGCEGWTVEVGEARLSVVVNPDRQRLWQLAALLLLGISHAVVKDVGQGGAHNFAKNRAQLGRWLGAVARETVVVDKNRLAEGVVAGVVDRLAGDEIAYNGKSGGLVFLDRIIEHLGLVVGHDHDTSPRWDG